MNCAGAAPATADVEYAHAALQADLACDEIELRFLRGVERLYVLPIPARVDHARIEHALVEVVAEVVVLLPHAESAAPALHIDEVRRDSQQHSARRAQMLLDIVVQDASQHLIQLLAIPPTFHVGLARPQGPLSHDAMKEALVVHADIPRTRAIYFYIARREQFVHGSLVREAPAHRRVVVQDL